MKTAQALPRLTQRDLVIARLAGLTVVGAGDGYGYGYGDGDGYGDADGDGEGRAL